MAIAEFVKKYSVAIALTLLLAITHFSFYNGKIKPIQGDAQAYYAYLPAVFIYHDLNFSFIDEINEKHYAVNIRKSFLVKAGNSSVNKTFPGAAIYYAPMFFIAHATALTFNLNADGYSLIYQLCFDIGYWLYLFLGLLYLHKILILLGFSQRIAQLVLITLTLTTNVLFYTVFNQSITHIFNFFTVNLIVYLLIIYTQKNNFKYLLLSVLLLALLGITRPTNIITLLILPVFIDFSKLWGNIKKHLSSLKHTLITLLLSVSILCIPFVLWKIQSGNWIVYSYGKEGFNFKAPELLNFTFSYLKGWFTYTPIALIIIVFGSFILFKKAPKKLIWIILFYSLAIYIFSSWWCWYYGAGQGQRVMIDHLAVLGLLLAYILQKISFSVVLMRIFYTCASLFLFVNIIQAFQIAKGILPHGSPTKQQYWDNFLTLTKKARIYPYNHWQVENRNTVNLTDSSHVKSGSIYTVEQNEIIQVTDYEPYSANLWLPKTDYTKKHKLVISFEARARTRIEATRAVVDFQNKTDMAVFGIDPYLSEDEWIKIEFMIEPSTNFYVKPVLYFWNGGTAEKVEFRNISYTLYRTDEYL